ncbi:MAG TPA: dipeptidase [Firmicutes bacterium]|nr:dipeptidase [Bacillota bacterium]
MNFFDLHCDTIVFAHRKMEGLRKNSMHISLEKGRCLNKWCQTYAVYVPDTVEANQALDYVTEYLAYFHEQMEINKDLVVKCTNGEDIEQAAQSGRFAAVLSIENGRAFGDDMSTIERYYKAGVRIASLTWNNPTLLAGGAMSNQGLTALGKVALSEMERVGMVLDVSHASERTFYEAAECYSKPFIATHSNSFAVYPHRRNLTDDQFALIRERGGLVGLNFYKGFISKYGTIDDLVGHADHFLSLGGEDILAMGSDFDGAEIEPNLDSIEKVENLANAMLRKNYPEKLVHKIFYDNAYEFFVRNVK